jgi:hypothetical protein
MSGDMLKVVRSCYAGIIGEVPSSYDASEARKYIEKSLVAGHTAKVNFMYKECSSGTCNWQVQFVGDSEKKWTPSVKPTGNGEFCTSSRADLYDRC